MPSFGLKRARSRGRRKGAGKPAPCGILRAGQFGWPRGIATADAKRRARSIARAVASISMYLLIALYHGAEQWHAMPPAAADSFILQSKANPRATPCATAWRASDAPGAVISNQARYRNDQVAITGKSTAWQRTADSGNAMTFRFCPTCGSTVFWENAGFPGLVSVAIGNFADPSFPAPAMAVWEESRHPWVNLPPDIPPKRAVKQG